MTVFPSFSRLISRGIELPDPETNYLRMHHFGRSSSEAGANAERLLGEDPYVESSGKPLKAL
jgi:hypothetical protein